MLEGMAIGIKPMTNKDNKILNACIKKRILLYLHLIYLLIFYVIHTWVHIFLQKHKTIYIHILCLFMMLFGFVWVSLNNYVCFYIPSVYILSFQNSSRISLVDVNIKLHQISKIYFPRCLYFIVNLSQEIRTVIFLSSNTCKAFKQVRVKFQAFRKDIFQSCNPYK